MHYVEPWSPGWACGNGLALVLLAIGCGTEGPPEPTLEVNGRAAVVLPSGMTSMRIPDGVTLVPGDQQRREGPRIELAALPRHGEGVARTVDLVLKNVRPQASGMPGAILQEAVQAKAGRAQVAAGYLDWSYEVPDGSPVNRRHWVLELEHSTLHVSCVGLPVMQKRCQDVVDSVREIPPAAASAKTIGRRP